MCVQLHIWGVERINTELRTYPCLQQRVGSVVSVVMQLCMNRLIPSLPPTTTKSWAGTRTGSYVALCKGGQGWHRVVSS